MGTIGVICMSRLYLIPNILSIVPLTLATSFPKKKIGNNAIRIGYDYEIQVKKFKIETSSSSTLNVQRTLQTQYTRTILIKLSISYPIDSSSNLIRILSHTTLVTLKDK